MDMTHYAFATYVFLLVCAGIWLVGRLVRPSGGKQKGEKQKVSYDKEQRLFQLYQNIEDMLAGFEEYVEEARAETERSKAEISALLEKAAHRTDRSGAQQETPADDAAPAPAAEPASVPRPSAVVRAAYRAGSKVAQSADPEPEEPDETVPEPPAGAEPFPEAAEKNMKPGERVAALAERGLDKTQIAQQLGMSIREVTLAMKIKKTQ